MEAPDFELSSNNRTLQKHKATYTQIIAFWFFGYHSSRGRITFTAYFLKKITPGRLILTRCLRLPAPHASPA